MVAVTSTVTFRSLTGSVACVATSGLPLSRIRTKFCLMSVTGSVAGFAALRRLVLDGALQPDLAVRQDGGVGVEVQRDQVGWNRRDLAHRAVETVAGDGRDAFPDRRAAAAVLGDVQVHFYVDRLPRRRRRRRCGRSRRRRGRRLGGWRGRGRRRRAVPVGAHAVPSGQTHDRRRTRTPPTARLWFSSSVLSVNFQLPTSDFLNFYVLTLHFKLPTFF